MANYKPTNPSQGLFLPVYLKKQLQKGTFEYAIDFIIDNELNLSHLDNRYNNDETGAGRCRVYMQHVLELLVDLFSRDGAYQRFKFAIAGVVCHFAHVSPALTFSPGRGK